MIHDFENDAHDYLLNRMPAAQRAAFEQQLARDPGAREALKACADSLAAFACETAPAEPLPAADQRAALAAIVAATRVAPPSAGPSTVSGRWPRWIWPAAAAVLLALNLIEFKRPVTPGSAPRQPGTGERGSGAAPSPAGDPGRSMASDTSATQAQPPAPAPPRTDTPSPAQPYLAEIERLRGNVAELERSRERLRAEYDLLVRRLAAQAALNRDLHRLATMELVDAGSYARGERKDLVGVARGILSEPGIVVSAEPPPPPDSLGQAAPKLAYAWSVYDEREQRGFLNLYHLPSLAGEQAMHIWIRSADATAYLPVGQVPREFHGRSGTVQYTLPAPAAAPAEILITIEPGGVAPAQPTGPTVLRGP